MERIVTEDSISGNRNFFSRLFNFRNFDTETVYNGRVMTLPTPIVGDSAFGDIWNAVKQPNARKIGIYSNRVGTGLTTLMNYLNNQFIAEVPEQEYDYVILCHTSFFIPPIREKIASQIGISETYEWKYAPLVGDKRRKLLEALQNKRFVLLIDGIGCDILPSEIGVPDPTEQNGCKFIFSTPYENVCNVNKPDTKILFDHLSRDDSRSLFSQIVGQQRLKDTQIPVVAEKMVELCFDLPKVLVVVARLMKLNKKLEQWQDDFKVMKQCQMGLKIGVSRFKMDFAEDFYYVITFNRQLSTNKIPLTSLYAPGLGGEEGKRLLAVRRRAD